VAPQIGDQSIMLLFLMFVLAIILSFAVCVSVLLQQQSPPPKAKGGHNSPPSATRSGGLFLSAAGKQLASPNRLTIPATAAIAVSVSSVFSSSIIRSVTVSSFEQRPPPDRYR
jgi:hypothetical protein